MRKKKVVEFQGLQETYPEDDKECRRHTVNKGYKVEHSTTDDDLNGKPNGRPLKDMGEEWEKLSAYYING